LFDGLTITAVGILTVFAFLIVMVLAMSALRFVVGRLESRRRLPDEEVAAIIAAIHARRN